MTQLIKSCIAWNCDWKHRCDLYFVPKAQQHFAPERTGEHCHFFVPIKRREEDND